MKNPFNEVDNNKQESSNNRAEWHKTTRSKPVKICANMENKQLIISVVALLIINYHHIRGRITNQKLSDLIHRDQDT